MRLRLNSGHDIYVSPQFLWERRKPALLRIDTRKAFHPSHATTGLCLEILVDMLRHLDCRHALDVGCGSGILALAAAKLGVPTVVGVDPDPRAVDCSINNARINGLDESTHWLRGSAASLRTHFDCILANLPRAVLTVVWSDLVRLLGTGGRLVVSGMHDIDLHPVLELCRAHRLRVLRRLARDQSLGTPPPSGSYTWLAFELAKEDSP